MTIEPTNTLGQLVDQICAEYHRLGTLGRDIKASDWKLFDSLDEQLWKAPAMSISDLAAKARVLDKRCRTDGQVHSISDR
jgi:hypothetical protein